MKIVNSSVIKEYPVETKTFDTPFSKKQKTAAREVRYQKVDIEWIDVSHQGKRVFASLQVELTEGDIDKLAQIQPDEATGLKVLPEAWLEMSTREWNEKTFNNLRLFL